MVLDAETNIWKQYRLGINPFYRDLVVAAAERIGDVAGGGGGGGDDEEKKKRERRKRMALKVAEVGSFYWL